MPLTNEKWSGCGTLFYRLKLLFSLPLTLCKSHSITIITPPPRECDDHLTSDDDDGNPLFHLSHCIVNSWGYPCSGNSTITTAAVTIPVDLKEREWERHVYQLPGPPQSDERCFLNQRILFKAGTSSFHRRRWWMAGGSHCRTILLLIIIIIVSPSVEQ